MGRVFPLNSSEDFTGPSGLEVAEVKAAAFKCRLRNKAMLPEELCAHSLGPFKRLARQGWEFRALRRALGSTKAQDPKKGGTGAERAPNRHPSPISSSITLLASEMGFSFCKYLSNQSLADVPEVQSFLEGTWGDRERSVSGTSEHPILKLSLRKASFPPSSSQPGAV